MASEDDLVEKVARAMQAASPLYSTMGWDDVGQLTRDMWLGDARAALRVVREALGEPDEAALKAYRERFGVPAYGNGHEWRYLFAASPLGRVE